jgi:hypothetical protein
MRIRTIAAMIACLLTETCRAPHSFPPGREGASHVEFSPAPVIDANLLFKDLFRSSMAVQSPPSP